MPRRKCQCGKYANYNIPTGKPLFCEKCKTSDMIDVVHKRCPCGNRASFNVPIEKTPACCKKCKTDDMIVVVNKRCPCGKQPSFNIPGEKPICCITCRTQEMVNVVSKKCICGKIPTFNVSGGTRGVCCKDCKNDGMVDVKSKRCPCGKYAQFNVPGGKIGTCCFKCKTDEMINVIDKVCPGYNRPCPVRTQLSKGHEYCMTCDPNDARRKQYKRYEEAFFDYVKDKIDVHQREFRVSFDQTETAKKYARLDGIVFGDGIIVCLEVDENGHQDYECDEHRMHLVTAELLQKYPGYVVSWVRVNPTTDENTQTSKKSQKIRENRFEDVVVTVDDILKTRDTRIVYIGF